MVVEGARERRSKLYREERAAKANDAKYGRASSLSHTSRQGIAETGLARGSRPRKKNPAPEITSRRRGQESLARTGAESPRWCDAHSPPRAAKSSGRRSSRTFEKVSNGKVGENG